MHRNSIFFSLQELNTILRFVMFLLFVGQHSCFAIKEQGKQLSIILVVKVVILSAKIISGIHTLAGNCLKLTLCLLRQTADSSQLLNGKNPSQCFLSLSISLIGTCTSSTLLLYSFCSLICMLYPKPPRQVVDRCLCYTVFKDKYHLQYKDRYIVRNRSDTLIVRDSIPYKVEIEKQLSKTDKAFLNIGKIASVCLFIGVLAFLGWIYWKLKLHKRS